MISPQPPESPGGAAGPGGGQGHGADDDSAWIRTILQGEGEPEREEACRRLMVKYWTLVAVFARSRIRHREEAEDIAQEVFLRAFRSLDTLRNVETFPGWLLRIAGNLVTDRMRARRRSPTIVSMASEDFASDRAAAAEAPTGAALVEADEDIQEMLEALAGLPDKYRDIIVLRYLEGIDGKTLARAVGEPEGTLRNRLFRALEKLRRRLMRKRSRQP